MTSVACLLHLILAVQVPPVDAPAPQAANVAAQPQTATAPRSLPATRAQDDEALRIGKLLRCPVCQGMPIAESPATMAQDMMRLVREMLAAGKDAAQIEAYFIDRYGDWVLLDPAAKGINWIVWLLPPLSLILCALWALSPAGRHRRGPAADAAAPPEAPLEGAAAGVEDPYLMAVRREVERRR